MSASQIFGWMAVRLDQRVYWRYWYQRKIKQHLYWTSYDICWVVHWCRIGLLLKRSQFASKSELVLLHVNDQNYSQRTLKAGKITVTVLEGDWDFGFVVIDICEILFQYIQQIWGTRTCDAVNKGSSDLWNIRKQFLLESFLNSEGGLQLKKLKIVSVVLMYVCKPGFHFLVSYLNIHTQELWINFYFADKNACTDESCRWTISINAKTKFDS